VGFVVTIQVGHKYYKATIMQKTCKLSERKKKIEIKFSVVRHVKRKSDEFAKEKQGGGRKPEQNRESRLGGRKEMGSHNTSTC